ncbi:DNA topoisomerase 4 subunit A [bacterium]|nr:DNA topoisomerase 4 subunit A [bacterium]
MARKQRNRGFAAIDVPQAEPKVDDVTLADATRSRYLNYALSVITSRALPDVRDGLKPVQRRILYAMGADLSNRSDGRYVKSAAVVGEVIKSYHPHGDQSIYDALVRMAQPFSLRYPLIDGYGNFGSIDGDPPAAMRYTECRVMPVAEELLAELGQDTVEFRPNYAATVDEPEVLPARVPNLLINGATGIAVGMATNIPPHNVRETIEAMKLLVADRDTSLDRIMDVLPGPDFPTGGVLVATRQELLDVYARGSGSLKVRGTWERDSAKPSIVWVTSIPYTVQKDPLVEKIGDLISRGQVPQLVNVKDLSTDDVRIQLELAPGTSAEAAMAYLYKNTALQTNFGVNLTCLLPAEEAAVPVPARLDLRSMLLQFLDFRLQVVTRRLDFERRNLEKRIHTLEGFAILFDNLDEAIRIIRNSDGKADALPKLCDRFGLTEAQSDAILETKLYRLGKLEILDILGDLEKARARLAEIQALLGDVSARWRIVGDELAEIGETYGDARRTTIEAETSAAAIEFRQEDYIVDEDAWVIVSRDGWLKRQKSFTEIAGIRVRDDDALGWVLRCRARQSVTFFSNRGVAYTMRANEIALTTGHGDPVQKFFQFDDGERIVGVISHDPRCLPKHEAPPPREPDDLSPVDGPNLWNGQESERPPDEPVTQGLLIDDAGSGEGESSGSDAPAGPFGVAFTAGGKCLRFSLASYSAVSNRKGRQYMRPDPVNTPDDVVIAVFASGGREHVCLASVNARVIIFPVWEIPVVGGAAKGVLAIKLAYGDRVLGAVLADSKREGLTVRTNRGAEKVIRATRYPVTRRGGRGLTVLQREGFESIMTEPVEPLPSLESIASES